jgi:hypothetical protein
MTINELFVTSDRHPTKPLKPLPTMIRHCSDARPSEKALHVFENVLIDSHALLLYPHILSFSLAPISFSNSHNDFHIYPPVNFLPKW